MTDQTPDYPVCPVCGEKHPPRTPDGAYRAALARVLELVTNLVKENPGAYPELEEAINVADQAATRVILMNLLRGKIAAPPNVEPPLDDDRGGFGMYL